MQVSGSLKYISSLPADIVKLAKAIRSNCGIENNLHWILDVTFNEDQSRIRKGNATQDIAMIRHVALNLLKQAQKRMKGVSVKTLRKAYGWNNETMSQCWDFNAVALYTFSETRILNLKQLKDAYLFPINKGII